VARSLADIVECDPWVPDTILELTVARQANNGMVIVLDRQSVDQVDHSVLHAASAEVVNHMGDEDGSCRGPWCHGLPVWSSWASRAALWAVRKSLSVAAATLASSV
jgi:hypothetical protein